jgi:hypothetical protein
MGVTLVRRLLALAVAALLLVEGAGVARAFAAEDSVECCCGHHSSARACHCKSCPVGQRRSHHQGGGDARVAPPRECDAHADGGLLLVIALLPSPPLVEAPLAAEPVEVRQIAAPFVVTDPSRPPP